MTIGDDRQDLAVTAPLDWAYCLFPLRLASGETLSLEWILGLADDLIESARRTGDRAYIGPLLHWAHQLQIHQGPDGDWPSVVNARTGAAIGSRRTRAPAHLLERLGDMLCSTEFDENVTRAASKAPQDERSE